MAQWNQVAQVGFIKPFFSSTTASPLLLFHPPVPILPTDPNFNLLSLSLSSIFRPPRRIFPFDVAPPSLLLSMLTCHWPLSTSFMNLSPITYPVNLYSWYSWSGGAPLLSIEAEIDSRFFFQGIEPRLSRNIRNSMRGKKLEMVAGVTTRRVIWAAWRGGIQVV